MGLKRLPKVAVFVRHASACPHRADENYRECDCAKWLRWSLSGRQYRQAANTRSWDDAIVVRGEKQKEVDKHYLAGTYPGQPTKRCSACKHVKPQTEFFKDSNKPGGLQSACKSCKKGPRDVDQNRRHALKKYGLDVPDFWTLFNLQKGKCRICQVPLDTSHGFQNVNVDHCHQSDRVRSILCGSCNRGLGLFKEDPSVLARAAKYCIAVQTPNSRGAQ